MATPQTTAAAAAAATKEAFSPPATTTQRSPWHSPVPYLFGGLAAILGLIAFALLILACSYWKLSDQVNGREDGGDRDVEGGEKGESSSDAKAPPAFEEKVLVIMAGEVKPTFLATPISNSSGKINSKLERKKEANENEREVSKGESASQEQIPT
ncbi:UNVERIFIED_CONTAM: protein GLUTAMINE DUMPER 1 [Sesamum radiatum]|uniref:Protein GLUTAMINE DUMPER 1 n=1 Tax=Sesamum radiatum TaxID=300843 RepID=A0AAW2TWK5_SESRA